jgi:flagellar motor switch protein FliG
MDPRGEREMTGDVASGLRKAAVLMVLLGEDAASVICRNLEAEDLRRIAPEIAELEVISPDLALPVLQEGYALISANQPEVQGGFDYMTRLLTKTFGSEGVHHWLEEVRAALESRAHSLNALQTVEPQQLARFLKQEHPQTIALTLAHLDAKQGSALLALLPESLRTEAVKRLAELRQFSPEVAQRVSEVLQKRLSTAGGRAQQAYAGLNSVAELLNQIDAGSSKAILESIEKEDAELALNIRNRMFTFEDLLGVPEAGIREWLGNLDKKTLALALRGGSEEVRNYIFKSMSSRAVEMLKEDMEVLGPVRSRDVQKAQEEAIAVARKLEAEGKLVLRQEGEDEYIV